MSSGEKVAIKIMDPKMPAETEELMNTEVDKMLKLQHGNILRLLHRGEGVYKKPSGSRQVKYIVLELASTGELFDILATTGPLPEHIARYYFKQFIEGLEFCHRQGIVHRDLKTENLLLDKHYNLKIADFGFSADVAKNPTGLLETQLGTPNFMSPEIHEGLPYDGRAADLFASGVILFLMMAGHPPFVIANKSDIYYKVIQKNNASSFWQVHMKNKDPNAFSKSFCELVTAMLQTERTHRPSVSEIMSHSWMNGKLPTQQDVYEEMTSRANEVHEQKRKEAEEKKAQRDGVLSNLDGYDFSQQNRSLKVAQALEIKEMLFNPEDCPRPLDQYIPSSLPHFFSNCKPEKIEEEFINYLKKENMECKKNEKKKFKLQFTHTGKYDDSSVFAVQMCMRIYIHNKE